MWVALLRGVNVGGSKKLPMAELRAVAEGLGWSDVSTLLASGNLIFDADGHPADLASTLEAALADSGLATRVVMRTHAELVAAEAANPYLPHDKPNWVHTYFLLDEADKKAVMALDPNRSPGDEYSIAGYEIYVRYGEGSADSKLSGAWFEKQLSVVATARNANTVAKLIAKSKG